MPDDIAIERHGHVEVLTLARPEVHNALRQRSYDELEAAVRDTTARVLVITGAGRSFCSGDDVRELLGGDNPLPEQLRDPAITPAAGALLGSDVPVIAAVNGPAVGWGMELALMADLRIASERARFGELFVKRGLVSDVAGLGRLVQIVGREAACELLFTGRVIDALEARELGLVRRVVPHDDLLTSALDLAQEIAANPPLAVARIKAGLRRAADPDWSDLGRWVSGALAELIGTEDHREGVQAFLEKREPVYRGR